MLQRSRMQFVREVSQVRGELHGLLLERGQRLPRGARGVGDFALDTAQSNRERCDTLADVSKVVIVAVSALSLVYGWPYLRERNLYPGEAPVLVMFATAGMMMMVSAGSLVMVYLGLELLALCSYALVALNRDDGLATEAAMKYIVLGSLASGLLLYGMSLVYGATGTLDLAQVHALAASGGDRMLLAAGMVFMVAGIAFKFGAAPFHMWLPDTYQGAPTAITVPAPSRPSTYGSVTWYRPERWYVSM